MKGLLARLFGRRTPPVTTEAADADELRDFIRGEVAAGYSEEDAILSDAVDVFGTEWEPATLRREAQRLLRAALADHRRDQAGWPERTDYDRLDDAFAALEAAGIVARQNFTCCGTCASAEIWDEIDAFADGGGSPRGYAYFHLQDTESAVDGQGLWLGYGACEDGEAAALGIAREIVAALERQGLSTQWNGSWSQRIGVTLVWQRRR